MFELIAQSDGARAGILRTVHGDIPTPVFMPVGTRAAVRGLETQQLNQLNIPIILANCYHLMVTPSASVIEQLGGLHRFMNFHKPILTDSGGFQVWSLAQLRSTHDDGVTFRSHRDGSLLTLTPQSVITAQHQLGSTISMVLDECPDWTTPRSQTQISLERTHRWAWQALDAYTQRKGYGLFAITQGGSHEDLRVQSAQCLTESDRFDGYAIGGLSVGEKKDTMQNMVALVTQHLPAAKPRYLMGVGRPLDLLEAVARGVDMFDCVLPTRCGRNGKVFTHHGEMTLRNSRYQHDSRPLDDQCSCPVCQDYSRAYLHHLLRNHEMNAASLLSWHNIAFYHQFMTAMREAIIDKQFKSFYKKWTDNLSPCK